MFEKLSIEQRKQIIKIGAYIAVLALFLAWILSLIQAIRANARAWNAIADSLEDGGPVIINVAQFTNGNNASQNI